MKKLCVLFSIALMLMVGAYAEALPSTFLVEGSVAGGTGAAELEFLINPFDPGELRVIIRNTSPNLLDDGSGDNAPGITGFGFDLDPDLSLVSWDLTAFTYDSASGIFSPVTTVMADWDLEQDGSIGNLNFDYLPNTFGSVDGALYNKAAVSGSTLPGGQNDVYFTDAVLTLDFGEVDLFSKDLLVSNPLVRMQNVGEDGDGSLKLTPDGPVVPEPSTVFLLGIGLLGILGLGRKLKK